jgi:hypothetical protein
MACDTLESPEASSASSAPHLPAGSKRRVVVRTAVRRHAYERHDEVELVAAEGEGFVAHVALRRVAATRASPTMPNPRARRALSVGSVPVVGRVRLVGVDDGDLDGEVAGVEANTPGAVVATGDEPPTVGVGADVDGAVGAVVGEVVDGGASVVVVPQRSAVKVCVNVP